MYQSAGAGMIGYYGLAKLEFFGSANSSAANDVATGLWPVSLL
jgi:hypothetical protein